MCENWRSEIAQQSKVPSKDCFDLVIPVRIFRQDEMEAVCAQVNHDNDGLEGSVAISLHPDAPSLGPASTGRRACRRAWWMPSK